MEKEKTARGNKAERGKKAKTGTWTERRRNTMIAMGYREECKDRDEEPDADQHIQAVQQQLEGREGGIKTQRQRAVEGDG